jgi:hypothetical protein
MLSALALTGLLAGCSVAQAFEASTVALFLDRDPSGISHEILSEMRQELARLFLPAGLNFVWRTMDSRIYGETYPQIVVVRIKGGCRVEGVDLLLAKRGLPGGKPLGSAFVEEGRILPFAQVDCNRVLMCLRAELFGKEQETRERMYGRGLARVLAHELYHILLGTEAHARTGVAKSTHSGRDLACESFTFEPEQIEQLRAIGLALSAVASGGQAAGENEEKRPAGAKAALID